MEQKICQSCSMPMQSEHYATERDGAVCEKYCSYCYQNGAFTSDGTMEEMIETCVPFMVQNGMPEAQARALLESTLPLLERWKR